MPKDTHSTLPAGPELVLPERVTIALAELAGVAREGLLALAVGTGLGVLGSLLDADVQRLAGPKGRHQPDRTAVRHGTQPSRVTLGGRRVRVNRPRVRRADGTTELALPTWQAFAGTELLDQLALERMLAKLSTRRYQAGLEPVGRQVEQAATSTSKSAVSRRFVAATERALAELLAADLAGLDLVARWTASAWPTTPAWWRWGSPWMVPRSRSPWPRERPRTPPSCGTCWPGCATAALR
jgi:putative transposase